MPRLARRHIVPGLLALTAVVLVVYIMTPISSYDPESWDQYLSQSPLHLDLWKHHPQDALSAPTPAPPKSCDRCDVAPEFCARVGSRNLDLATGYEGSGDRIRRVLAKAARGEPIVFGMVGGSLSRGHGCKCTTFHRQIFDWFNTTWPHAGHQYVDGSVGARGSNYFKFCHVEHLPQDADIVILETALNDDPSPDHAKNMESMLRAILQYKNKPAVLVLSSFSLMGRLHMGGDVHLAVQQYYDVPVINLRHALLPVMQMRPKAVDEFFVIDNPVPNRRDQIHLNAVGHATLANFGIAFLERQKCLLENPRPVVPASDPMFLPAQNYEDEIPRLALLTDSWSTHGVAPVEHPTCATIDSATNPFTPDPATKGWTTWTQPHTTKNYWRATEIGARFEYTVKLTQGHVMLYYLKSAKMGLGRVKCWLNDDEKDAVTIDSYWDDPRSIGMFSTIRETSKGPLSPGDYVVRCEVIEKHPWGKEEGRGTNFNIIAVLTV